MSYVADQIKLYRGLNLWDQKHLPPNLASDPRACLKEVFRTFDSKLDNDLKGEHGLMLRKSVMHKISSVKDSFCMQIPILDLLGDGRDIELGSEVGNTAQGM